MDQAFPCGDVSPECPVEKTMLGYAPNLGANMFYAIAFGVLCGTNLVLGVFFKTWTYMVAMCCACIAACIGYVGRILMHYNAYHQNGFLMQICALILSPAFNSAAIYLTLKHVTQQFGPEFSRIRPALYTYIFIAGDLIAMVLQAVGGAFSATADDHDTLETGDDLMNAGVSWQVACLAFFCFMATDFVVRRWKARNSTPLGPTARATLRSTKFRLFAIGVAVAIILIVARCIYRIVEMAGGWGNSIMRQEIPFIILEGAFILTATLLQTILHPGYCFPALTAKAPAGHWNYHDENARQLGSRDIPLSRDLSIKEQE